MKRFVSLVLSTALLGLSVLGTVSCEKKEHSVDKDNAKAEEKLMPTTLSNTYYRLTVDKELNVAYLGGSITQGAGASTYSKNYVARTTAWLSEKFPDAVINENNAGLSNTGSNYGIFRLREDILDIAVPDLIFIEFTSNDWGRFGDLAISRQNESIIRMLYEANPKMDIVFLFTNFGSDSPCRRASTALAKHYGLPIIDPGSELKAMIDTEHGGDYSPYSADNIHPNDAGYEYYIKKIDECFGKYLIDEKPEKAYYADFTLPEPLNKDGLFLSPKMIDASSFELSEDFTVKNYPIHMCKIKHPDFIECTEEGKEFEFTFSGTGFGLLVYKSATVSDISYSVDGGEYKDYSIGDMHYYNHGQMYIMEYNLTEGEHTVKIRNKASSVGSTLRIIKVCVNEG